jgi:hypothetical protein
MKTMIWTCDRCRSTHEVDRVIVISDEYSPAALEKMDAGYPPGGWTQFRDDAGITDVCPSCVTAGERADQLLLEAEADFLFGPVAEPGEGA